MNYTLIVKTIIPNTEEESKSGSFWINPIDCSLYLFINSWVYLAGGDSIITSYIEGIYIKDIISQAIEPVSELGLI